MIRFDKAGIVHRNILARIQSGCNINRPFLTVNIIQMIQLRYLRTDGARQTNVIAFLGARGYKQRQYDPEVFVVVLLTKKGFFWEFSGSVLAELSIDYFEVP